MHDKKELQIVSELRKDARMAITKICKNTRIPISTIYDKIKLNRAGIIKRNTALLDFSKLGYACRVTFVIKLKKKERDNVADFLKGNIHLNSLYKINNGYDFLIDAVFRNVNEVENFIELLDENFKIAEIKTYYVIRELMSENFMTNEAHINSVLNV